MNHYAKFHGDWSVLWCGNLTSLKMAASSCNCTIQICNIQ